MYVLGNCKPTQVFKYFEEISKIPRGSGNEKAVSDYIYRFAVENGLEAVQDDRFNLVIKKTSSAGYENSPTVIIQGHLDMVCEKNNATTHDFLTDPIDVYIDGDFVKARGTTLGGDNGIAVAYAMALMSDRSLMHPPLEIVLTTDEEVGMNGAAALSPQLLTAKMLINIDSEEEGFFLSSCAGGIKCVIDVKADFCEIPNGYKPYTIAVGGLNGGHSGMDIHKERGNSNKIMGCILNALRELDIYLQKINGGSKDNAIPRECEVIVFVPRENADFEAKIGQLTETLSREYAASDPGLTIAVKTADKCGDKVFTKQTFEKILSALMLTPNGVIHMSKSIPGLVETSNNLGVVRTDDVNSVVSFVSAIRSSVKSRKYYLLDQLTSLARLLGGSISTRGNYPSWEYNPDSNIRKLFEETYKEMYGKDAVVTAVHAGLECGLFAEKVKGIDMISFGPDMFDVHTPYERMSITSVNNTWEFLINVLSKMK